MGLQLFGGGQSGESFDPLPSECALDQQIREVRILGQQRSVQVGSKDIPACHPFVAVLAIVSRPPQHPAERL
jgi:hypothetical protein